MTVVGRSPESLTLPERFELAGQWAAFEIYSPETTPLRRIEAVGARMEDCVRALIERGLDPKGYEFIRLPAPF
jgi:hypothetical protein